MYGAIYQQDNDPTDPQHGLVWAFPNTTNATKIYKIQTKGENLNDYFYFIAELTRSRYTTYTELELADAIESSRLSECRPSNGTHNGTQNNEHILMKSMCKSKVYDIQYNRRSTPKRRITTISTFQDVPDFFKAQIEKCLKIDLGN